MAALVFVFVAAAAAVVYVLDSRCVCDVPNQWGLYQSKKVARLQTKSFIFLLLYLFRPNHIPSSFSLSRAHTHTPQSLVQYHTRLEYYGLSQIKWNEKINNKIHFALAVTPLLFFIVSQNIHICICLMLLLLLRRLLLLLLLLLSLLFSSYYCCSLFLLRPQLLHNNKVPWLCYGIIISRFFFFCRCCSSALL